jgi:hypothetical protein
MAFEVHVSVCQWDSREAKMYGVYVFLLVETSVGSL